MHEFFQDAHSWVLLSFILFAIGAVRFGKKKFLAKLDGRIAQIRDDISTAERLRDEAQALLAEYQTKQRDAAKESEAIIASARNAADVLNKQAQADLDEMLSRKETQLAERLQRMEDAAKAEIQAYAAELAIKATAEIITSRLDAESNRKLVDATIQSLPKQLN